MALAERVHPKRELKKISLDANTRSFINTLRHVPALTSGKIFELYSQPNSVVSEIVHSLPDAESVFVFDCFVVMQARDEAIRKEYSDDSSLQSTIPIIRAINRLWAVNQAFEKVDFKVVSPVEKGHVLEQLAVFSNASENERISLIKNLRKILEIDTPPSPAQAERSATLNRLLSSIIKESRAVSDIEAENADSIKPGDYGLSKAANTINIVKSGTIFGDRHFLNTARGLSSTQIELLNQYLVPSLDINMTKLTHQPKVFTKESALKLIPLLAKFRYDDTSPSGMDLPTYYKKLVYNAIYEELSKKLRDKSDYSPRDLQGDWLNFVKSLTPSEMINAESILRETLNDPNLVYQEYLAPGLDRKRIFQLVTDYLPTVKNIDDIILRLNEVRIAENRPLTNDDFEKVFADIRS